MSLAFETRAGYGFETASASYGDGASRGTDGFSIPGFFSVSDSGIDSRVENAFDGRDAGYGAAAAARQRLAHERAAREGAERSSRTSQFALNPFCERVRASEHAPRYRLDVLERAHGLAEIVERGAGVVEERPRVIHPMSRC